MSRNRVGLTVAVWLALSALLWMTDASPAVFALGAIVAVLSAIFFVMLDLARSTVGVAWLQETEDRPTRYERDPRVTGLIKDATAAGRLDSSWLHVTLVELVDDRLATNHDIDRAVEPEAAMAVLTPELRRLVTGTQLRNANPRTLQRVLSEIEAL